MAFHKIQFRIFPNQLATLVDNLLQSRLHEDPTSPWHPGRLEIFVFGAVNDAAEHALIALQVFRARALGYRVVPGVRLGNRLPANVGWQAFLDPAVWAEREAWLVEAANLRAPGDGAMMFEVEVYTGDRMELTWSLLDNTPGVSRAQFEAASASFFARAEALGVVPHVHPADPDYAILTRLFDVSPEPPVMQLETSFGDDRQYLINHERGFLEPQRATTRLIRRFKERWPECRASVGYQDSILRQPVWAHLDAVTSDDGMCWIDDEFREDFHLLGTHAFHRLEHTSRALNQQLRMSFQTRGALREPNGLPNLTGGGSWLAPASWVGATHAYALMRRGQHGVYSAKDGHWQVASGTTLWQPQAPMTVMLDFAIDPLGRSATGTHVRDAVQPLAAIWLDIGSYDVFRLDYVPANAAAAAQFRLTVRGANNSVHSVAVPVPADMLPDYAAAGSELGAAISDPEEARLRTYPAQRLMFTVSHSTLTLWFQNAGTTPATVSTAITSLPAGFTLAPASHPLRLGAVGHTSSTMTTAHNVEFLALHVWDKVLGELPQGDKIDGYPFY